MTILEDYNVDMDMSRAEANVVNMGRAFLFVSMHVLGCFIYYSVLLMEIYIIVSNTRSF